MLTSEMVMEQLKSPVKVDYIITGRNGKILANKGTGNIQGVSNSWGNFYGVYGDIVEEFHKEGHNQLDSRKDSDEEIEKVIEYILKYVGDLAPYPENITEEMKTYSYTSIIYNTVELREVAKEVEHFNSKKDGTPLVKLTAFGKEYTMNPEDIDNYEFTVERTVNLRGDVLSETGHIKRKEDNK